MTFRAVSQIFEQLEQTQSRLAMTEQLSVLFRNADKTEIGKLCYLLQGRVAPLFEPIEFGIADKFMIRAIARAYDVEPEKVVETFRKAGDLGVAAQTIQQQVVSSKHPGADVDLLGVFEVLKKIAETSGLGSQEDKIEQVSQLLRSVDGLSARYIVRIPLGKMRLGFSDMTILDGLSWMITGDKSLRDTLESAYNVRADIGFIAGTLKNKGIEGLSDIHAVIGAPILSALCQRLKSAEEMIEKMGKVSVDPKYDGVRVQIHWSAKGGIGVKASTVQTFSRNLENTTEMFPELDTLGKELNASSVIIDAEAVGIDLKTGKILPFQQTTTRKRKHDIAAAVENVPLRFYVFDMLYKDGEELLHRPFSERRELLEKTIKPGNLLSLSPQIVTEDPDEIRAYHHTQLENGLEGVVVKKWDGLYESGRRSYNWVKFKEEEGKTGKLKDTIDAVVMGYYRGEGKRSTFGIGAFLVGVKKDESFETITKIGTGVSDELWKALFTRFEKIKTKEKPKEYGEVPKMLVPDVWLSPSIVIEVAGDDLTKSSTHGTGYAIRFPRLVGIREDKSPEQATTVDEVFTMYEAQ